MRVVLWSVDPQDWRNGITTRRIVRTVLTGVRPGSIVLMHDGGGDRSQTAEALPAVIEGLLERGFGFVRVAEMVNSSP